MTQQRRLEVLSHIRLFAGDAEHFREGGSKDVARQLGIWYMVRKYLELKDADTTRVDTKIQSLFGRYPDMRDLMTRYAEYAEQEYLLNREAGNYADVHGAAYLNWSLKSFGERLYVYDPRSS
jgi:hypothetical protein